MLELCKIAVTDIPLWMFSMRKSCAYGHLAAGYLLLNMTRSAEGKLIKGRLAYGKVISYFDVDKIQWKAIVIISIIEKKKWFTSIFPRIPLWKLIHFSSSLVEKWMIFIHSQILFEYFGTSSQDHSMFIHFLARNIRKLDILLECLWIHLNEQFMIRKRIHQSRPSKEKGSREFCKTKGN